MVTCPFCKSEEKERIILGEKTVVIFPCMFSPIISSGIEGEELQNHLDIEYGSKGSGYFQNQCEVLHLSLTKPT